jgi:hypothetical protein
MPDLGDGGGRPELGYDTDTGPAACHHPSRTADRCEGGLSVLFCVLFRTPKLRVPISRWSLLARPIGLTRTDGLILRVQATAEEADGDRRQAYWRAATRARAIRASAWRQLGSNGPRGTAGARN